ncbi:unnamed protein product [Polarella glacialis]|uniref:Uncharacterized protein n=1 Tax=Polarella glacialis TaxID=89957 RepID=A0A813L0Y6_POLGL|nr:unnamed protein product [Polarella glacialis]CAE8717503.1 unnamed protein product [Polarella glacialis]
MGFERLLFMDIDVFPVSSPAALLGCRGAVCAPTAASEWRNEGVVINTGVMVVEPGAVVSEQLGKASREITGSYNKGDQGFLNLFFVEWCVRPERLRGRALPRDY